MRSEGTKLLDLDDDCLFAIFGFISIIDLCSIAQTSVRLNEIGSQMFDSQHQGFVFNKTTAKTTFEARKLFQIFGSQMLQLDIDFHLCVTYASDVMDAVIRYCRKLECLYLRSYKVPDNKNKIAGMAKLFRNLQTLNIENVSIEGFDLTTDNIIVTPSGNLMQFFDCKCLVNLVLNGCYDFKRITFESYFPNLQHFTYTSAALNDDKYIDGFIFRHKHLKSFSLNSEDDPGDFDWHFPALNVIPVNCKDLEKIEFGLGFSEHPAETVTFLQNLSRLRKLRNLKMFSGVDEVVIKELPNFRNKLEVLDLSYVYGSGLIQAVSQLKKLRFFRLYDVAAGVLVDINPLSKLTKLTTLFIENVYEKNLKFDLVEMVDCLVNLTKLQFIVNDFKIDNKAYRQLVYIVERRPDMRNRFLHVDCPKTNDFLDLELAGSVLV